VRLLRDSKNAQECEEAMVEMEEYRPRSRAEEEAHAALMIVRAAEKREKKGMEKLRMPSIAKWYQCMGTYVTGLMIVGGRLSAGLLMNHITVMGQVLEQLSLKKDVSFKDAFLAYDVACRQHWWKASSNDYRGFVLSNQMCGIDFDRLTRMERENPRWEGPATAGAQAASSTAATGYVGKGAGGGKPPKPSLASTQCLGCGQYGHMVRYCPQQQWKQPQQPGKGAYQAPPPPPAVFPPQLALGNGADAAVGKGGKHGIGGKNGKVGKGKR
jgi:hypothetical protein